MNVFCLHSFCAALSPWSSACDVVEVAVVEEGGKFMCGSVTWEPWVVVVVVVVRVSAVCVR